MLQTIRQAFEQTQARFEGHPYLEALAIVLGSLIVAKIVDFIITRVLSRLTKTTRTDFDDRFIALAHKPIFYSVFLVGFAYAVTRPGLNEGLVGVVHSVLQTFAILIWWGFLSQAVHLSLEALARFENRFEFIQPRTTALLDNTAKIVIGAASLYAILLSWGINVSGFLVSAGVLGLALGLAAKDTLANLFSGIFIIADAPYKKGDFIILDSGERGMVTDIGLRSTRLLTRDDIEVTVPNAVIANSKIINETGGPHPKERVRVKVGVAYGSDIDQIEAVLMDIARGYEHGCKEPEPRVRFRAFGESSLDFELLMWIDEPVLRGRVLHELNCEVYKRFNREGIEIPFPQRDVHLHTVPGKTDPPKG